MTPNTNPSAQPVSDGELEQKVRQILVDGKYVGIDLMTKALMQAFGRSLSQAAHQSYQSGYAAAVGDAVACAPKECQPAAKDHELIKTCDHHNVDFDNSIRLQNYSYNYGINEYRINIEKLKCE